MLLAVFWKMKLQFVFHTIIFFISSRRTISISLFEEPQPIPDDEDISYEMLVHKKRYDTSFYLKVNFTEEELKDMEEKTSNMTEDEANLYFGTKALENISGQVWFTISEHYGKYYISLYYDNLKNRANGEDL